MRYLEQWNAMPAGEAAQAVLACCGSAAWARELAARRPLTTLPELLAASDAAWWSLGEADWQEAFDSHPRLGERHSNGPAEEASLRWSRSEGSTAMPSGEEAKKTLAEGNHLYEERFGRIFIVCATGKSTGEILLLLQRRMLNTPEAELQESAEQQRQITHLRLQRWLSEQEGGAAA